MQRGAACWYLCVFQDFIVKYDLFEVFQYLIHKYVFHYYKYPLTMVSVARFERLVWFWTFVMLYFSGLTWNFVNAFPAWLVNPQVSCQLIFNSRVLFPVWELTCLLLLLFPLILSCPSSSWISFLRIQLSRPSTTSTGLLIQRKI